MVRELLPALVRLGHIQRSALGVRVDLILADDMVRLKVGRVPGAIVRAVQPQSGAAKAGIRVDDIIVEFQGQPIGGPERLRWLASMAGVNERVTVRIQRQGRFMDLVASLGELPATASPVTDELDDDDE